MRLIKLAVWCLACAILGGCEQKPLLPPRAFQVQGRLFIDNALAGRASIGFYPIDQEKSQGRCPVAMTNPDGSFELTTYSPHDGAPEGDYAVTVMWLDDSMPIDECECPDPLLHDRLGRKYADPLTTPLQVTVLPQNNYFNLSAEGAKRTGLLPGLLPPRVSQLRKK